MKAIEVAKTRNKENGYHQLPAKTSKPGYVLDGDPHRDDLADLESTSCFQSPHNHQRVSRSKRPVSQTRLPFYFVNHMPSTFVIKRTSNTVDGPIDVKLQSNRYKVEELVDRGVEDRVRQRGICGRTSLKVRGLHSCTRYLDTRYHG